jgi:sec-independent protein translocase protein TatA
MGEWLIILLIVLLVFGAGKLPDIGDALGRSIRNFKRASAGDEEIEVSKKPAKEVGSGKKVQQIEEGEAGADDDDEFEEVVVRRRKQKSSSTST